jgi:RNA polymerase sigma factor (TIGR02999 family)
MSNQIPERRAGPDERRALELLAAARLGEPQAIDELLRLIYPELKRRARWLMAKERTGHTFGRSGGELVQRVLEKILESGGQVFSAAQTEEDLVRMLTQRMRFILVDYARAVRAAAYPSPGDRVAFDKIQDWTPSASMNLDEVLNMNEVLTKLAELDPDGVRAVELRYFAGLTNDETAAAMGLSVASMRRILKRATVFVKTVMGDDIPKK